MAEKYTCKYCGYQSGNASSATFSCRCSPHGSHEWMNNTTGPRQFTCKYCGYQSGSAGSATFSCHKSPLPKKTHEWLG